MPSLGLAETGGGIHSNSSLDRPRMADFWLNSCVKGGATHRQAVSGLVITTTSTMSALQNRIAMLRHDACACRYDGFERQASAALVTSTYMYAASVTRNKCSVRTAALRCTQETRST